uniref:Family with sequence similarity 155 member A n=1 Tax=Oryctolagus cuniculus TaxID=9986 RepID=A0A5F9C8M1_RABIT
MPFTSCIIGVLTMSGPCFNLLFSNEPAHLLHAAKGSLKCSFALSANACNAAVWLAAGIAYVHGLKGEFSRDALATTARLSQDSLSCSGVTMLSSLRVFNSPLFSCFSPQIVYKAWLCSQYFEVTQLNCRKTIPCKQYCLEVQTRCPFILPDNDDVIYGGLSSFICTGLYETFLTSDDPECCDVRREEPAQGPARAAAAAQGRRALCPGPSLAPSSATRLCGGRLKLCVLVLMLLHTVLTASAAQSAAALSLRGLPALDDNSTNEE